MWSRRDFELSSRVTRKKKASGTNLPTIECSCGVQILLVPNIKQMSEAIEAHIIEHTKKIKVAKVAEAEAERIRDDLIAKVLDKASEL